MMDHHPDMTTKLQGLEDVALEILREMKLSREDREALEKAIHVARALRKSGGRP